MNRRERFQSAIMDRDGASVNPGYLWIMQSGRLVAAVVGVLILGGFLQFYSKPSAEFPFMAMAGAIATILGAYGGLITLTGGFMALDGKGAQMAQFPPAAQHAGPVQIDAGGRVDIQSQGK